MPEDVTVYGMEVNKLQSGIKVDSDNVIHGILHYVEGYDGYSQGAYGNFVALRVTAPADATVEYTSEAVSKGILSPNDRLIVWKVPRTDSTLTIKVERDGESASVTYKAEGLILEQQKG